MGKYADVYLEGVYISEEKIGEILENTTSVVIHDYEEWIKFLFDDEYYIKDVDKWNIFESMYYHNKLNDDFIDWSVLHKGDYLHMSECEIIAVVDGVESALAQFADIKNDFWKSTCYRAMKELTEVIDVIDDKEKLIEAIRDFYSGEYNRNQAYRKYKIEYNNFVGLVSNCDAPAFAVKVIAEKFGVDFWEIWSEVNDVVHRILKKACYEIR